MRTIYFDTNVYDPIAKMAGLLPADFERLRAHVREEATLCLSVHNLEEAAMAVESSRELARTLLMLMTTLASNRHMFSEPRLLYRDALHASIQGRPIASPFADDSEQLIAVAQELARTDKESARRLAEANSATRAQMQDFFDYMTEARSRAAERIRIGNPSGRALPFKEYFHQTRTTLATHSIRRIGEEPTQERVNALLEQQYPRACFDASASLFYAWTFERRVPDFSDGRDLMHAAVAGFVDVFITNDARARRILNRIPNRTYVVESLNDLLTQLDD